MKFEEMPVEVQKLFSEPYWGDVLYRPPPVPYLQPYVGFREKFTYGPLSYLELIKPERWPRKTDVSSLYGNGFGFAGVENPLVVQRPPELTVDEIAEFNSEDPSTYNPDLEFCAETDVGFSVVNCRVFQILETNSAIFPDMWRDILVADSARHTPAKSEYRLVDFPRYPVVDYQRSTANWQKVDLRSGGQSYYRPLLHFGDLGKVATHDLVDAPPILRDTWNRRLFIRPKFLSLLEREGVIGPDYSVLDLYSES